ncbi:MAG: ATP-binding cassette domain-containing protein [Bacteroidetes bacterium]|nr:ATP-binding cassette domain-containing protein [Bacteroidota bacterium]
MLELKNIQGGYIKGNNILKGVDLSLSQGEVLAILGQNGSGKTTLAKAILNVLPLRGGSISLNNKDISSYTTAQLLQEGIAYFLQGGRIFPSLTVEENITFALQGKTLVEETLEKFPVLQKYWRRRATVLSGGERNQLALAMVVVKMPKWLILDEPTAGLSPKATLEIYRLLNNLDKNNIGIILIEQNIHKAIEFANKVIILKNGVVYEQLQNSNITETQNRIEQVFFN